jgi:hypothetical protein
LCYKDHSLQKGPSVKRRKWHFLYNSGSLHFRLLYRKAYLLMRNFTTQKFFANLTNNFISNTKIRNRFAWHYVIVDSVHSARLSEEENVVLSYLLYLPDLAPCDFLLFPKLKKTSQIESSSGQTPWLCNILVSSYNKCLQRLGQGNETFLYLLEVNFFRKPNKNSQMNL